MKFKYRVSIVAGKELEDFLNDLRETAYLNVFPNTTLTDYFYVIHGVVEKPEIK
jgi:hypothetical protein